MSAGVSQSRFHMWRTLFAIVHADNVVTDAEVRFMAKVLEDIDFSPEQEAVLKDDINTPKNVEEMFAGITDRDDRAAFFNFARELVWVDGDFAAEEQDMMIRLKKLHYWNTNVDDLVGTVNLRFEEERDIVPSEGADRTGEEKGGRVRRAVMSFRRRFLETIDD